VNQKTIQTATIIFISLIVLIASGYWAFNNRQTTVTKSDFCLGTLIEITATGKKPEKAITSAFQAIRQVERLTSSRTGSDVSHLNRWAGRKAVKVAPETLAIIKLIQEYDPLLSGAFDPTLAPLIELWGFGYEGRPHLPEAQQIQRLLPLVDRRQVLVNHTAQTVFLAKPGMKLDLGGIAKGYAIDRAYRRLRQAGIKSALINGGNSSIRVIGVKPDRQPWQIGIGHPRRTQELLGQLTLPHDSALGTSADTQNYFSQAGRRYSHLLNPQTGYPARNKILVTVAAPTAAEADLLSTACFILPLDQIKKLIAKRPAIKVIVVNSQQQVLNLNNCNFHQATHH
jgi:thiamine biosynthesis lipoprotein